jgi:hypothetical protein
MQGNCDEEYVGYIKHIRCLSESIHILAYVTDDLQVIRILGALGSAEFSV